ncbi:kinase-like protein [Tricholoma matsutake]|nr:kinase-like protein [Tricholoma matsutake 945]
MATTSPSQDFAPYSEPVRLTSYLTLEGRRRKINQYLRGDRIGKGQHGEVFLCTDEDANGREMALKVVKRNSPRDKIKLLRRNHRQNTGDRPPLSSTEHSIRKEIAVMKKCRHANIVRLFEVIDDPQQDKIFLAMEYLSGGQVQWTNGQHQPILSTRQTRRILRDVILGLEYLHHQGIIHRDIKPANLLWTSDRAVVKIIDFGVSHFSSTIQGSLSRKGLHPDDVTLFPENDLLKRIGTPSFLAPEVVWFADDGIKLSPATSSDTLASVSSLATVQDAINSMPRKRPPVTKAIDIWSLAVTLYCFLFGHTPFNVPVSTNANVYHNEFVLYNQICTQDWVVDDTMGAERASTGGRHPRDPNSEGFMVVGLLNRMLQKDPRSRVTLLEIKRNPWILCDISEPKEWLRATSPAVGDSSALSPCRWVRQASRKFLDLFSTSAYHTCTC